MLVVDAQRAGWRGTADEQLQVILTGAIQQVAVQERAAAAGINPDDLHALVTPVPVELGLLARVADRGRAERRRACRLRASALRVKLIDGWVVGIMGYGESSCRRVGAAWG